jgi:hypothetical protein
MKMKHISAVLALAGLAASGAYAQTETAIDAGTGFGTAANVTYNGSSLLLSQTSTYRFASDINASQSSTTATITLGPLTDMTGAGSYSFNSSNGNFSQMLNGSTFTVSDGTGTLLSGSFGNAVLSGVNGGSSGGVQLVANSVTYTGGSYFPAGFQTTNGSLSLEFTSVTDTASGTSGFRANASGVSAFTAHDGATFSAVPTTSTVPEPGTYAAFLVGGLGVLGLMASARKRSLVA